MQFPTIHLHTPSSRNALTRSYQFLHYRSISKVNKNALWVKGHNLRLVHPNDMGPKALVRGLQDLSKMSKNMVIWSKLSKIYIGEVGKFLWNGKSQLSLKLQFLTKGPTFFHLIHPCHATHVSHDQFQDQIIIFPFLFNFYGFNSF